MHLIEPWGLAGMLIWIAALLVMVWMIVRTPDQRPVTEDALAILRARFARGELSQAEYEQARDALFADQQEFTR